MPYRVSKTKFAELVERALAELPEQFADFLEEVPLEIRTRPTARQLRDAGLEPDEMLFGLYTGAPLTERSVEDPARLPDAIFIFQEDHEEVCEDEQELIKEVRTTVLHEIGHHFGLDEDDLKNLGYE
jgi:predicted Zn-dependent protease with MMP-like domain